LEVFSNKKYLILSIFIFFIFIFFFYYFTQLELNIVNLGLTFVIIEIILEIIISFLIAIFIPISIYKFKKFNKISLKENSSSFFGGFLGILIVGCPACSITFASYIGLASFVSLIPGYGLGLKIISVPFLIYSNYSILKNLNYCKNKK